MTDERATIRVNGEMRPFEASSLVELLRARELDPERPGIAVAVNGEVVPRAEWAACALKPGDEVEIVGAVQGG